MKARVLARISSRFASPSARPVVAATGDGRRNGPRALGYAKSSPYSWAVGGAGPRPAALAMGHVGRRGIVEGHVSQ